jgi:hypothetical protein
MIYNSAEAGIQVSQSSLTPPKKPATVEELSVNLEFSVGMDISLEKHHALIAENGH